MTGRAVDHRFTAIDRLLTGAVTDGVAPGFVAAIADSAGVLHAGRYGVCAAGGAAMTDDTIVWLASMTKLVTTIAALQLVEAGDLELDAPVAALLPELAQPVVLSDAGTRPARAPITLRHLLTHTSGIGYELMNPALFAARGPDGPPPPTSRASLSGPLALDPGSGWIYGFGVDWAGIAVERRSRLSLDRYFIERIFDPLGMCDTGFVPAASDRLASVHLRDGEGGVTIIPSPAGAPEDWEFHSGGAGLYGTAPDYIRLLRMLLRGGELGGARILQARTVAAMWDNQIGSLPAGRIDSALPMLIRPFDPLSGQEGEWSLLGLRNPAPVAGGRSAGSAGWFGVAGTVFWIDRTADLCGVLLAQMMPFGDPALTALQQVFERTAYAGAATRHKEAA